MNSFIILNNLLLKIKHLQPFEFITGGALGVDTWAASIAIDCGLEFTLALPFPHGVMTAKWKIEDSTKLLNHSLAAKQIVVIDTKFTWAAYQKRNKWMVNNCDLLIAWWIGKKHGGTWNCIQYAEKVNKPWINLRLNQKEK